MATRQDTNALIAKVLAGDPSAFDEIVRRHRGCVYRTCLALTRHLDDAEEAMWSVFFKVHRNLSGFRQQSAFTTWLTRIAINESLQQLRRRRPEISLEEAREEDGGTLLRRLSAGVPTPEQEYAAKELRRKVWKAVARLPRRYGGAFVLCEVRELTAAEAAVVLGITAAAAKSRRMRAQQMVRKAVARQRADRVPRQTGNPKSVWFQGREDRCDHNGMRFAPVAAERSTNAVAL